MILVLAISDFCLGGALLRFGGQIPGNIPKGLSDMNSTGARQEEQENTEVMNTDDLGEYIASKSCAFVQAAFERDKLKVEDMLCTGTIYVISEDNSSYIRYASKDMHVEGYMATDRKLVRARENWHVTEEDGTITSGVEVLIEGEEKPQIWYIHYRKSFGRWKIFMLENGI
jgi:hypothetical protein